MLKNYRAGFEMPVFLHIFSLLQIIYYIIIKFVKERTYGSNKRYSKYETQYG